MSCSPLARRLAEAALQYLDGRSILINSRAATYSEWERDLARELERILHPRNAFLDDTRYEHGLGR